MHTVIRETPMEYFHGVLTDALAHEGVSVEPLSEFYIVRLLAGEKARTSHPADELHILFARAISEAPATRDALFRDVGDRALLTTGLWWAYDFRRRRAPRAAALIRLGSSAYWTIGSEPFEELARKFEGVVYVLARLGADATLSTYRDLLRLHDLWERTGSPHAARALARHGLMPAQHPNTTPS